MTKSTEHQPHRTSPSSPSKRRQQSGQTTQPQPIAPAPATGTNQPIAPAPPAGPTIASPTRASINTDVANAAPVGATVKSPSSPTSARKRKAAEMSTSTSTSTGPTTAAAGPSTTTEGAVKPEVAPTSIVSQLAEAAAGEGASATPPAKKSRTNTPWTPAEERRLKTLRDAGSSWGEIAKEFPNRTEGSVKKHWYKDMHYADFAEDESAALLAAIREYEQNKWKEIGKKVGKPAKVRALIVLIIPPVAHEDRGIEFRIIPNKSRAHRRHVVQLRCTATGVNHVDLRLSYRTDLQGASTTPASHVTNVSHRLASSTPKRIFKESYSNHRMVVRRWIITNWQRCWQRERLSTSEDMLPTFNSAHSCYWLLAALVAQRDGRERFSIRPWRPCMWRYTWPGRTPTHCMRWV